MKLLSLISQPFYNKLFNKKFAVNISLRTKVSNGNSSRKYNPRSVLYRPRTRSCYIFIFPPTYPARVFRNQSIWFCEFYEVCLTAICPGEESKCFVMEGNGHSFLWQKYGAKRSHGSTPVCCPPGERLSP